ncbi:MAG: RagB/SusD family nutrient uptake outer membrane protein, partial [Prevotella sp.]|nr:RagB/SusD family nutrient uptake outer membrane protein [Prevotella sp.]
PSYGTIRSNDSKLFYFPIYILLGDLNLWAGNYKEAALNYYYYISRRNGTNVAYPTGTASIRWSQNDSHWRSMRDSWSTDFYNENNNRTSELISMIPGDSIPSEGNYSELRNLFNCNETNDYKVSLKPSQSIIDLSASQPYCHLTTGNDVVYAPTGLTENRTGDLRLSSAWSYTKDVRIRTSGSNRELSEYSYINKYSTRNVHIYRRTMVYLRMAEALNRAGYPRFAFEILKNGVNNRSIESNVIPYYTADSTWIRQFDFPNNDYVLESRSGQQTENTMGIHGRGSGFSFLDDKYVLPDDTTITDSIMRRDYQIIRVEDMIVDEEALEFAFEGYRFYDLMRVALRRNNPAYLADRIYKRRGAAQEAVMKGLIRHDLNDTRSWYLNWNNKIGLGY